MTDTEPTTTTFGKTIYIYGDYVVPNVASPEIEQRSMHLHQVAERAQQAIQAAEKHLKGRGRLLVRFSGTEPLLRVMAEGENQAEITEVAQDLVQTLDRCLN